MNTVQNYGGKANSATLPTQTLPTADSRSNPYAGLVKATEDFFGVAGVAYPVDVIKQLLHVWSTSPDTDLNIELNRVTINDTLDIIHFLTKAYEELQHIKFVRAKGGETL